MNALIIGRPFLRLGFLLVALASIALWHTAQAVVPPPDGGYPGGNTAEGQNALFSLTTGGYNTAVGYLSLRSDTTGQLNTAVGAGTLLFNTADENTAFGAAALLFNTTGFDNTAVGAAALLNNTSSVNTAFGSNALRSHMTGGSNNAVGASALVSHQSGQGNNAFGTAALGLNVSGFLNTAVGDFALENSTGSGNTALGARAGRFVTTGSNNIHIGNEGLAADDATIRIGTPTQTRCFIAGIRGVTTGTGDAIPVIIDSTFQLGTMSSSRRYKKEIKPMDKASESILALTPVTFRYKTDKTNTPQFGLIAEEVAKVNPDLVARDGNGEIYSVRYEQVNAMLLNEFLKEHKKVEELRATVAQQQNQIEALASGLQKMSTKLEITKNAPQVATNSQ